jgi:two-component system response regulator AlgR
LERQFSTIAGVDSMNSVSRDGNTRITLQFSINRDIDAAAQDVQSAIAAVQRRLPDGMEPPTMRKLNPADSPILFLGFTGENLTLSRLNEHLLKLKDPPSVIFVTAYQEHAVKAFELNAIDYLMKPIRASRLAEALSKARAIAPLRADLLRGLSDAPRQHLSVTEGGRVYLVPITDILYFKAELKYVTIRTAQREYLAEESLTRLEQEYHRRFVRIHRNCLVAREAIVGFERLSGTEIDAHWIVLLRGLADKLPISRRQQHIVRELSR